MKRKSTIFAVLYLMFFISSVRAQIPNNGFENWANDEDGEYNPVEWLTTNSDPYLSTTPYTPAYAGNYSMKVSTVNFGIGIIPGVAQIEFPYSSRPTKLNVCLKTNVVPGDKVYIVLGLLKGDTIIAGSADCTFVIDSTIENYTCMSFDITYINEYTPTSASIMIIAGIESAFDGTYIVVDELEFDFTSDINQIYSDKNIQSYPNPAKDYTLIPVNLTNEADVELLIMDSNGKLAQSIPFHSLSSGRNELRVNTSDLSNGMYVYSVKGKDVNYFGKMVIHK